MVPKGWEKTDLTHLINIKHGFAFKSEYFREAGEYILLTPGSFYEKGGFKDQKDKTKYYIGEIPDSYLLSKNDLLIAMTEQASGLLGSALFVPEQNIYLHNQRLGKVEIKAKERIDLNFLYLMFNSPLARKQISEQSTGTKVKHTSPDKLKSIICLLPPLPEQQKIAKILSTWDKAISTTERLIENSTQQKKALMQQLLTGKKRLLDESGQRLEGEWEQVIFGDVSKLSSKKYNPLKANQCLPCIELEHLDQGSGRIIGSANASELASIKNYFEAGSVLFGKLRPYLRKYARPDFEGVCSTEIWVFKTTSKLLDEYLFHFVQTDKFVSEANKSSGSKMPRADWGVISELVIKIPNLKEQQKIATVLTNADKEIKLLEQQLADLQQEKKALMQVLLTGKKRVVV